MNFEPTELLSTLFAAIAVAFGYYAHYVLAKLQTKAALKTAEQVLGEARKEADTLLRESKLQARDEVLQARERFEQDHAERRRQIEVQAERVAQQETTLDRKLALIDKKEQAVENKLSDLEVRLASLQEQQRAVEALSEQHHVELQRIAAMTEEEARRLLLEKTEEELRAETSTLVRHAQEEARASAEQAARSVITTAIERYAAHQTSQVTTSTVSLPSEEMKGRIIGKEGRNIRALEAVTGVNFLVDDTPEVVVISGFDPMRREVARVALERLIADGRIQPGRIEEVVEEVRGEVDQMVRRAGEEAIYELGLQGVAPELVKTVGQLKFRHSYSQNVLQHSIETAQIMGLMAAELGLDASLARRVGLLHDIGKAIDHSVEGGHAQIGADLLKRHGESALVCNAVAAHHEDVERESPYAALVSAADAITAARPGARSENTELFLKRLENLEAIANSYRGVEKSYAIQAGRELRVMVTPTKIDDHEVMLLARNICKQIEQELRFPGQIKVTVIRETRCIEYAK